MINVQMAVTVVIHFFIGMLFYAAKDYPWIAYLCGIVFLFNIIGMILIHYKQARLGAWVFLISSLCLTPIGIIGALGAKKLLDELKQTDAQMVNE